MNKTTFLMAAVLAVATVLTAGLTVLPGSVQEAHANPCSDNTQASSGSAELDISERGEGDSNAEANSDVSGQAANIVECDLTGVVINEEVIDPFAATQEEAAEAAEAAEDAEFE